MVFQNSMYTKHFYIEGQRIVSKLGEMGIEQELLNPKSHAGDSSKNPVKWDSKKELTKDIIIANFEALGLGGAVFTSGKSGKMPYGQIKKYYRNTDAVINPGTSTSSGKKIEDLQFYYHPDHLGSSNYITDVSGEVYQHQEFFPFGETFVEERNDAEYTTYLFNGKELDEETGLYYYGARYYDARTSLWQSLDPMMDKYPGVSPFTYCYNNPLVLVDVDGLYPKSIFEFDKTTGTYHLKASVVHLLNITTGVSNELLSSAVIQERAPGRYRPFYKANKGGGAITIGKTITFTENFFEDNYKAFKGHGYGLNTETWLDLLAHEVGHLPQTGNHKSIAGYLIEFGKQYATSGNHDAAPYEIQAENRRSWFTGFSDFTDKYFGAESISKLLNNNKLTEEQKISKIDTWNKAFGSYLNLINKGANPKNIKLNDIIQNMEK